MLEALESSVFLECLLAVTLSSWQCCWDVGRKDMPLGFTSTTSFLSQDFGLCLFGKALIAAVRHAVHSKIEFLQKPYVILCIK